MPSLLWVLLCTTLFSQNIDYFTKYRGGLPVKVYYGANPRAMTLLGVDAKKGIIYGKMETGQVQFELRGLKQQNISGFRFEWPKDPRLALKYLSNEQYSPKMLEILRPHIYKVLLYLDIPFEFMPIHDDCLVYCKSLVEMEQYAEAFHVLSRLNLSKLDEFGYREFSELALDLAGKMIVSNPKSAKTARSLLQLVTIRDDSGDHASYLQLVDSLRRQGLYTEAISEYGRLGPIVSKSINSPYKEVLRLWPIYCYLKLYESYSKAASRDKRYAEAAGKMFNTALQMIKKIDEDPPSRQSNEFSLYKLIQPSFGYSMQGNTKPPAKKGSSGPILQGFRFGSDRRNRYRKGRGLDWLPESLMMAGDAYENLELTEAARERLQTGFHLFQIDQVGSAKRSKIESPASCLNSNPQLTQIVKISFLEIKQN